LEPIYKELQYSTSYPKNSKIWVWDGDLDLGIRGKPIPVPGFRGQKRPWIRIRKDVFFLA